jgi:hypothetical protein
MSGLANRVDPFGTLFVTPSRGMFLGNRGGQFHCAETQSVRSKPYASRQWICCLLSFKERRREVWGWGYTELFFADEVSALAAGHRPCFECRRVDATAFATAWGRAHRMPPPRAPQMDIVLHRERLQPGRAYAKRLHRPPDTVLPEGTMIAIEGRPFGVSPAGLRPWSFEGFGAPVDVVPPGPAMLITPPSIVAVLGAGYRPAWRLRGASPTVG